MGKGRIKKGEKEVEQVEKEKRAKREKVGKKRTDGY